LKILKLKDNGTHDSIKDEPPLMDRINHDKIVIEIEKIKNESIRDKCSKKENKEELRIIGSLIKRIKEDITNIKHEERFNE